MLEFEWPHVLVDILARDGRRLALRFECSGYPDQPPTATPWDRVNERKATADEVATRR